MNKSEKRKSPETFTTRDYILYGIIVLAVIFSRDVSNEILNYPDYLNRYTWAVVVIVAVVLRFRKFEAKYMSLATTGERLFYAAITLVATTVGSWIAASILFIPLNYYNVYVARQTPADTVRCGIESVSIRTNATKGSLPNYIDYTFQGRHNVIKTEDKTPLIANMYGMKNCSAYQLKLTIHKGFMGSYWLEDWKIESKGAMPFKNAK